MAPHRSIPNVMVHDIPGSGDEDLKDEQIQEMISSCLVDIIALVVDTQRAMDTAIRKHNREFVQQIREIYKKQTTLDLTVFIILTKTEDFLEDEEGQEELGSMETKLKGDFPETFFIRKTSKTDTSEFNGILANLSQGIMQERFEATQLIRNRVCHSIIWRNAGKAAAYALLPGLDMAFYIILTDTVDILLCALYGKDIMSIRTGIPAVINLLSLAGRGIFVAASILAKVLEVSVIFYAVGAGVSSTANMIGVVTSGYITWHRLCD
jgi:hypothetical protein